MPLKEQSEGKSWCGQPDHQYLGTMLVLIKILIFKKIRHLILRLMKYLAHNFLKLQKSVLPMKLL